MTVLLYAGQAFQDPGQNVGVRLPGKALFQLLTQRHHRRPGRSGDHTLPQCVFHHAAMGIPVWACLPVGPHEVSDAVC